MLKAAQMTHRSMINILPFHVNFVVSEMQECLRQRLEALLQSITACSRGRAEEVFTKALDLQPKHLEGLINYANGQALANITVAAARMTALTNRLAALCSTAAAFACNTT